MTLAKPYALNGRPLVGPGGSMYMCPICQCLPPWVVTCDDMLAYLDILQPPLNGTRIGPGYILINFDDILQPVYQHFLGAMTFLWDGMRFIAFVTCKCSFVTWALKDTYEIHEQSDACECLADMLLGMYATRFGGTAYGEGAIVTPGATPEEPLSTEPHGGAVVFSADGKEYIATRSCDPEDCTTFGIRELITGEYYREMFGVCDCPEIIDFVLTAEENGYTVFGPSLLHSVSTYRGEVSFSYRKVSSCYFDAEVEVYNGATNEMETGGWRYANCGYCTFGIESRDKQRMDFPCDGCVDIRKIPFAGLVAEQYGSHACYKGTFNGVQQRRLLYSGTPTDVNNGGGYVDFRTKVALYDIDGKRYLVSQWITGNELDPIRTESFEVPIDTVFDGYAELLKYQRGSDGVIGYHSNMPIYGIPGDTFGARFEQEAYTRSFLTEAEAIAYSLSHSTSETYSLALFNYYQMNLENMDKRTADCADITDKPGGVYYESGYEKPWSAFPIKKVGTIISLRMLETNKGFLMLDGSFLESVYIPTLSEVQACAQIVRWEWDHGHWGGGYYRIVDRAGAGEEDPICPNQIDPEEFE